jgi:hypothetical protein
VLHLRSDIGKNAGCHHFWDCFGFQAERGRTGAVVLGILIFIGYIIGTTFVIKMFGKFDNGKPSTIDAVYFNFATLSTIGEAHAMV